MTMRKLSLICVFLLLCGIADAADKDEQSSIIVRGPYWLKAVKVIKDMPEAFCKFTDVPAKSMADIGMPAVAPLLKQIQSSTLSATEFQVSCVTLEAILGKELAKAALTQHSKQFPELRQRGRLKVAMKLVDLRHLHWSALDAKDFRFK